MTQLLLDCLLPAAVPQHQLDAATNPRLHVLPGLVVKMVFSPFDMVDMVLCVTLA
jgi:hypothetical protein